MNNESQHIDVTGSARNHIRSQVQQHQAQYLRLGVKESGCNGYMYTLDFLDELQTDDIQVDIGDNINICIRRDDLPLVAGTEVDMVTEGLNSSLVFKNSRAQSYCGCGESFALGDESDTTALDVNTAALAHDASKPS
ncbi:MAG: iron-sulfur cluster assembly accessory protein [Pseudomonadales bacterium]|nr:iron-sulfur cluster assembly accessory protein [Pseudomonadales bacterium]